MIKIENKTIVFNISYGCKHMEYARSCEKGGLISDALTWYHKAYLEFTAAKEMVDSKNFELYNAVNKKLTFCIKKMEELEDKLYFTKDEKEDITEL